MHALPRPPASDSKLELSRRLRELSATTKAAVDGEGSVEFFRAVDSCYTRLKKAVLRARPTVRLTEGCSKFTVNSSSSQTDEEDPQFWLNGPESTLTFGEQDPAPKPEGLITLKKARKLAASYRVHELPTFPPYRVLDELVQSLKGRWDSAAQACVREVGEALEQLSDKLVAQHFGQFAGARHEIRCVL